MEHVIRRQRQQVHRHKRSRRPRTGLSAANEKMIGCRKEHEV